MKSIEKGSEKGRKKVYCETPRRGSLFPPFFVPILTPFLHLTVCMLLLLHTLSDVPSKQVSRRVSGGS
jgi:hypothetical protein